MLYNKNNVRKTNDKKILHKVGKQWKVVSVALLMAIGGGAVATHAANAQSNNGVNASTSAEVTALETKPAVASATSVAPSSVASSASAKSAKSASSVSYMQDNGGSAASYHAKAINDNAQYKVNSNVVQSYVNSLNTAFPDATNSLNNNYTSAAAKTAADKADAQSYSAIANNKNYSSQVSTLASKAGLTYSGFVQSVSYQASNFANEVSDGSALTSQMDVVNSYAQLINNINSNSALRNDYAAKSVSATANYRVAQLSRNAAKSVYNHFVNASAGYQDAINSARTASTANSDAEDVARIYAGLDNATTNSLASSLGFSNSSSTSSMNHSIADNNDIYADRFGSNADYFGTSVYVKSFKNVNLKSASDEANNMYTLLSDTSQEDQYNAASASYNSALASYGVDSASVSNAIVSASAALNSANNSFASAQSEYYEYHILGDNDLTLANLFASDVAGVATDRAINESNATSVAYANALNDFNASYATYEAKDLAKNIVNALPSANNNPAVENANNLVKAALTNGNANSPLAQKVARIFNNPTAKASDIDAVKAIAKTPEFQNAKNASDLAKLATNNNKPSIANVINNHADAINNMIGTLGGVSNAVNYATRLAANMGVTIPQAAKVNSNNIPALPSLRYFEDVEGMTQSQAANKVRDIMNADAHNLVNSPEGYAYAKGNLQSLANASASASNVVASQESQGSVDYDYGILDPASYSAASSAVNYIGLTASSVNSLANSAASAYTSVESASTAYSAATKENITLAGIYANSYSADANSDEAVESAAKTSLDNFYANHADAKYANASSDAASYGAAEPNDAALAHANGVYQFNHAPKYVTVAKNCGFYSNADFVKKAHKATIPAGTKLTVKGVGFSVNGRTRYSVEYNGKMGYVTSYPTYVEGTYLPTQDNVSVTVTQPSKIYNSANFSKKSYVGKTLPAGAVLSNVNIVSADNVYGGVTRLETPSGNFVSANVAYASLNDNDGAANNGNQANNNASHDGVVSYWK